ncbi:MAG: 50S ribosomal protein L15 [Bacteriovoracaceae bacterium]
MTLNNLKSPKGAHRNTKRIGRGQGSGYGTQAAKGHKGQKARAGGGVRTGFEGGNMPLYMRLPKKGFSNAPFKTEYAIVSLDTIKNHFDSGEVTRELLVEKGILKGKDRRLPIKILAGQNFDKSLSFISIEKFSKSAREAIEKAGGKLQ